MKPTQHYLQHVADTITHNGPLSAYSTRSQERCIGKYKSLIKSKSSVGENAGNVLERLATRSYINTLPWEISDKVDLLTSREYGSNSYKELLSVDSVDGEAFLQLWEPFIRCSSDKLPKDIVEQKFLGALRKFYLRVSNVDVGIPSTIDELLVSGRAWAFNKVYRSLCYADRIREHRRGNTFVLFEATHRK